MFPELQGQTAIITGVDNPEGIGVAIARELATTGVRVFLTGLNDSPLTDKTRPASPGAERHAWNAAQSVHDVAAAIRADGGEAQSMRADLNQLARIPALFDAVEAAFGPVSILVNNAAYSTADTFIPSAENLVNTHSVAWLEDAGEGVKTLAAASHDLHFSVNTRAPALMMIEFARRHIDRRADWGRVINISTDGAHCFPSEVAYGASKAALESYSRSAAAELGQFGIAVNVISPGPVQTGWITPEMEADITKATPLGRPGKPEDIAGAVLLLLTDRARWITGQVLHVGGGHHI